jgi:hypothetical protein
MARIGPLKLFAILLALAPGSALAQERCASVTPLSESDAAAASGAVRGGQAITSWSLPAAGGTLGCTDAVTPDGKQILTFRSERFTINGVPMIALYASPSAFIGYAQNGTPRLSTPAPADGFACERGTAGGRPLTVCGSRHDAGGKVELKAGVTGPYSLAFLSADGSLFGDFKSLDTAKPPQLVKNGAGVDGVWKQKMLHAIPYGAVAVFEGPAFGQFVSDLKPGEALVMRVWKKDAEAPTNASLSSEQFVQQLQSVLAVAKAMSGS